MVSQCFNDASSNLRDFEFETSGRKFYVDGFEFEKSRNLDDSMEHFADELFCNGKVAVPLKLPPSHYSSTATSPRSPSVIKLPFSRRSLWNDDFDPFLTALDKVREEKKENNHRRARSQSPLRTILPLRSTRQSEIKEQNQKSTQSKEMGFEILSKKVGPSPFDWARPKGLGIAEKLKLSQERPIIERGEKEETSRRVHFRSASMDREMRSIIHYRPKLFLCMGFGFKSSKQSHE